MKGHRGGLHTRLRLLQEEETLYRFICHGLTIQIYLSFYLPVIYLLISINTYARMYVFVLLANCVFNYII